MIKFTKTTRINKLFYRNILVQIAYFFNQSIIVIENNYTSFDKTCKF